MIDQTIIPLHINYNVIPGMGKKASEKIKVDVKRKTLIAPDIKAQVTKTVCRYYGVLMANVKKKDRRTQVRVARQVSMYLLAMFTSETLKEIGKYFGSKDHTTVMRSRKRIQDLMTTEPEFREFVNKIRDELGL